MILFSLVSEITAEKVIIRLRSSSFLKRTLLPLLAVVLATVSAAFVFVCLNRMF